MIASCALRRVCAGYSCTAVTLQSAQYNAARCLAPPMPRPHGKAGKGKKRQIAEAQSSGEDEDVEFEMIETRQPGSDSDDGTCS